MLAGQNPPAHRDSAAAAKTGHNQQPLQRQPDILVDVIHAHQKGAVLVVDHFVAAQEEAHRQRQQQRHRRAAQEARFQAAFQRKMAGSISRACCMSPNLCRNCQPRAASQ
jgi:hypothetical protein